MELREWWVFWSLISVMLMMMSIYEGKRIIKHFKITNRSTQFYIMGGLIGFWGFIALIALGRAGVG